MHTNDWLTTGEAASMLGVSRQHVVNLCDRGVLTCTKTGSHRRVRRSEIQRLLTPELTREQEKSLWLHRALLGRLMMAPGVTLAQARENIRTWAPRYRPDGMATGYLAQWEQIIDGGVDGVVDAITATDEKSIEMRQNSPFAGILSDTERLQVLRSFREHWDDAHAVA